MTKSSEHGYLPFRARSKKITRIRVRRQPMRRYPNVGICLLLACNTSGLRVCVLRVYGDEAGTRRGRATDTAGPRAV
eukprot:5509781-Prymnesium_polylepis.1